MHDQFRIVRAATTKRGTRCWVTASIWYNDEGTAYKEFEAVCACAPAGYYRLMKLSVLSERKP